VLNEENIKVGLVVRKGQIQIAFSPQRVGSGQAGLGCRGLKSLGRVYWVLGGRRSLAALPKLIKKVRPRT